MSGKAEIRIANMSNIGGVIEEMKRVYRQARREELDVNTAKRLVEMLHMIRAGYEVAEVERRLLELEARK